ncbi:MAG: tetratricopeptide repeat protein [Nodosilinea sp.]
MLQKAYRSLILEGDTSAQGVENAIALVDQAKPFDTTAINQFLYLNEGLCWYGSVYGHAAKVLEICDKAVNTVPNDKAFRVSRGLARALTGNVNGAIADFQFFIDHTPDAAHKEDPQRWLTALKAGQNPFTPAELEKLK